MTTEGKTDERLESLRIDPERKLPRRRRGTLFFALLAGIPIGFAISLAVPGAKPAATEAEKAAAATPPAPAEPKAGDTILTASGYVTPRRRIALSPQVNGQVEWVGVEKGQSVVEGQELVRLDDDAYVAQEKQAAALAAVAKARLDLLLAGTRAEDIAAARARVAEQEALIAQAKRTLDRARLASELGASDMQSLDDAVGAQESGQARLAAAQAELERAIAGSRTEEVAAARAELQSAEANAEFLAIQRGYTVIKAPSNGTILEKLIEVGDLVSPQNFGGSRGARTELLSIADLGELQVEVDINEADFQKIRMGNPAKVVLDAYPDRIYDASIREIAPEANREKATIQAKVAIKTPDEFIRPEMSARVDFVLE